MKPSSPVQLVRLLDQLHAAYPNGIPRSAIKAPEVASEASPSYLLVALSAEGALTSAEDELVDSIATKGLKLSKDSYTKRVVRDDASIEAALSTCAGVVIVFGGSKSRGFHETASGGRALCTFSLPDLLAEAAHKKELWRELQKLL